MLHFSAFHVFTYSSHLVDYVGGGNLSVTVGIAAWYFVVCLLASRLLCGGGLYVEVLGPSAAGELVWDEIFAVVSYEGVEGCVGIYIVAFIQVVVCGGFCVDMEPL